MKVAPHTDVTTKSAKRAFLRSEGGSAVGENRSSPLNSNPP